MIKIDQAEVTSEDDDRYIYGTRGYIGRRPSRVFRVRLEILTDDRGWLDRLIAYLNRQAGGFAHSRRDPGPEPETRELTAGYLELPEKK